MPSNTLSDSVGWGNASEAYTEGSPAPGPDVGYSLERKPGGKGGNGTDTNNNGDDFSLNQTPNPQNSGSPITPIPEHYLSLSATAPEKVEPGGSVDYKLTIRNQTGATAENVSIRFPLPPSLNFSSSTDETDIADGLAVITLPDLEASQTYTTTITFIAPWTYTTILTQSYSVTAMNWPEPAFGNPIWTSIEGGAVPIQTARRLFGEVITIEGYATMYTDGFYAGSSGTKFYIEDETGGIQVYVAGGMGRINVPIGAGVRVQGTLELYRGALEMIPSSIESIEIIEPPKEGQGISPTAVSLQEAVNGIETLPGLLVIVEGMLARVDEFSYSYEIDLVDDSGQLLTLYIDKLTEINIETIESGQYYQIVGILEVIDDNLQLYPRMQSDLIEVFPPELMISAHTANTVDAGEAFGVTLSAYKHTSDPLTDLVITIDVPEAGIESIETYKDVTLVENTLTWKIAELSGDGEMVSVSFDAVASGEEQYLVFDTYQVTALEWPDPASGPAIYTFIGSSVPVWAIQGAAFRSPYVLDRLMTGGVVSGVFPELLGFWIQSNEVDDDPLTSEGLFIRTGEIDLDVEPGDFIEVSGIIHESHQETQMHIENPEDIHIIKSGSALPLAVELDPPIDEVESAVYYEALEGMFVRVSGTAYAVSPTNKYGETTLVLPYHGLARLWQGQSNGMAIMIDDGRSITHMDQSTMSFTLVTGDEISGIVGPLAYTYGNYKIEPTTSPNITSKDFEPRQLPTLNDNEFSLMTWNVENLFDYKDPHPSSPAMPNLRKYKLDLTKTANTIIAAGTPTIIALQEVENLEILEDLAEHELLLEYDFQAVLIEGTDSRGIDVGYLVRGDQAQILDVQQHPAPEGITSRPPLVIEVEIQTTSYPVTLYVINNHFTSMSGGEAATQPRRNAQASWNVEIVEKILSNSHEAYLAVVGDLNSYIDSTPIDTLRAAGLVHVFKELSEKDRYTYIYQGISQTLDHILVTPSLMELLETVDVLHVNVDFPPPLPEDGSARHKSDHDPVITIFQWTE